MFPAPLSLVVPPALRTRALRAGFTLDDVAPNAPALPEAVVRAWATGNPAVVCRVDDAAQLLPLRPLGLFSATFASLFQEGDFLTRRVAQGPFRATEWLTRQRGGLILIENPSDRTATGSVFPVVEGLTLAPGEVALWLHDTPIGAASNYLGAYAGLVKSEAPVVTAHVRPDPHEGVRLFVTAPVGATRELVLFNAGPGEARTLRFGALPSVVSVGPSQVLLLPPRLAERLWVLPEAGRVLLGAEDVPADGMVELQQERLWELSDDGTWVEQVVGEETDAIAAPGWYAARIAGEEPARAASLLIDGPSPDGLWLNGAPAVAADLRLVPGENYLVLRHPGGRVPAVSLLVPGACYLVDVARWRYWPNAPVRFQSSQ